MDRYSCWYNRDTLEVDERGFFYFVEEADEVIAAKDAEIARLRKAIVMLARGDIFWSSGDREVWLLRGPGDCPALPCDGSPEQIVATVCRLAGGE